MKNTVAVNESKRADKAAFDFENYKISKFSFIEVPKDNLNTITLGFLPSGRFFKNSRKFIIDLVFTAQLDDEKGNPGEEIMNVSLEAFFNFSEDVTFDTIPVYFYRNALAIIFPYLRSFVSTLTFQANIKPVILPVMNLTALEEPFKQQTFLIEE